MAGSMRQTLKNEKGIALVTTLMLLVLGFALVAMLLRLVTAESKLSGLEQSYATALDAAKGGTDMFIFIRQNDLDRPPGGIGSSPYGGSCFGVKMNNKTSDWTSRPEWTAGCPALTLAQATDPDPTSNPDATFTLSNYTVNVKVVDTIYTVNGGTPPPPGYWYYTVNVRATAPNSGEHADISFIYRYDDGP